MAAGQLLLAVAISLPARLSFGPVRPAAPPGESITR
jgi:hypothetical protein